MPKTAKQPRLLRVRPGERTTLGHGPNLDAYGGRRWPSDRRDARDAQTRLDSENERESPRAGGRRGRKL